MIEISDDVFDQPLPVEREIPNSPDIAEPEPDDSWMRAAPPAAAGRVPAPPSDLFRRYTAAELVDMDRTFKWLVRRLLVDPTYGQIAGEEKTLKTYIAAMIWIGTAAGVPILEHFKPEQSTPVVVYVGEGGRAPITRRIERVADAMGVKLRDIPLHMSFDVAPIQSPVFMESFRRDLDEVQPGLVAIDPLYAFHGVTTEAKNLHQEGALLSSLSGPCVDAGASLLINNHFNQTGSTKGLKRITMAGAAEWVDSWLLLRHREQPDVANGRFELGLDVGSRQWGGTSWDVNIDVGRFDPDTAEYEGTITWDVHRSNSGPATTKTADVKVAKLGEHICEVLADQAWELTKTEVLAIVGGNRDHARAAWQELVDIERIQYVDMRRNEARGPKTRPVWALSHEPVPLISVRVEDKDD